MITLCDCVDFYFLTNGLLFQTTWELADNSIAISINLNAEATRNLPKYETTPYLTRSLQLTHIIVSILIFCLNCTK